MRADGTRVQNLTAIMQALPYIMPKRYDAQNWAEENLDEDTIRAYIREKRRAGQSVTHMSVLVRLLSGRAAESQAQLLRDEQPDL